MIHELKKAGRICYRALRYAEKIIDVDISLLEIAKKVETYILDKGGSLAFPVNISINEIAAHYTPIDDSIRIKEGDVVKIDVGVHIDGWISDSAITIEVKTDKYKKLIEASREALNEVEKILKKGIELWKIGEVIENKIKSYGFNPIYNLTGHKIDRWILHSDIQIPNFNNGSKKKIENGIYAIEPFATTGKGYVIGKGNSNILRLNKIKVYIRNHSIRKFIEEIRKEYKTLPFSKRWIIEKYGKEKAENIINYLKREKILYEYPILVEQSKGIVSQFEHTFLINNGVLVISRE